MKATLTVAMDNAAFADDPGDELAWVLRELADKISRDGVQRGAAWPVIDRNGNKVGSLAIRGGS